MHLFYIIDIVTFRFVFLDHNIYIVFDIKEQEKSKRGKGEREDKWRLSMVWWREEKRIREIKCSGIHGVYEKKEERNVEKRRAF